MEIVETILGIGAIVGTMGIITAVMCLRGKAWYDFTRRAAKKDQDQT
ncbi:MAG TPA: hypothetical protein IAA51_11950 [Candidatus Cottocaccamicrobium excrementipullorum]|nr:hypothetical protein [Candidatus Cottocaccamicrobium excrementipullorum]